MSAYGSAVHKVTVELVFESEWDVGDRETQPFFAIGLSQATVVKLDGQPLPIDTADSLTTEDWDALKQAIKEVEDQS